MDYGFTARIEEEFDEVAQGKMKWSKMLDDFYIPFKKDVDNTIETAERIKGERELGVDPESGKPVVARMGRYGLMVQIGSTTDEEKPRFAKIQTGQSIETITFEEAMDLFKVQAGLGEYEGKEISVSMGRFGPYVKWGDDFISIPKGTIMEINNRLTSRCLSAWKLRTVRRLGAAVAKNLPFQRFGFARTLASGRKSPITAPSVTPAGD